MEKRNGKGKRGGEKEWGIGRDTRKESHSFYLPMQCPVPKLVSIFSSIHRQVFYSTTTFISVAQRDQVETPAIKVNNMLLLACIFYLSPP